MREMKPLLLPTLVAARKSSKSSFDMALEPAFSVYSCADSGFYSASECSTPPTPSHASRGHLRYPSSTSSLSSSPPVYDPVEAPNSSGKLPKLTEEPIEREDDFVGAIPCPCSCNADYCDPIRSHTRRSISDRNYDFTEDCFTSHDVESHASKRRRSAESSANSITSKIESRFPSFTRKLRDRKTSSSFGRSSRSATPSRVPSTRSSSITSSIHQVQGYDLTERFPPITAETSLERLDDHVVISSPIDIAKANAFEIDVEQIDRERFATTPLLPPMLVKTRFDDTPVESPLQSPTVAEPENVFDPTPTGTPPMRAYPTPPLSSKPSASSLRTSRPGHVVPSSDIPPIMLFNQDDKWVSALGHANFTIQPEPYMPDKCDTASLRQLFADWEQARCNFTKHQVRTGEHHGVTSKVYLQTEQKWAEIDAVWKMNNDLATARAAAMGVALGPTSPSEPAPLCKMPTLNDPKSMGKFPKLGDEDIVGPMVQIASQVQVAPPSRKRAFFKLFSDMRFPGSSLLGRPSTTLRSR
ncbi:hypothetical protein K504DRAFT_472098 [Pleomassaria siparia CBS 279.74]|uniref:Only prolin and serin are matching in the corresponding protein n=1 Tax=Pleomassaria siparia CBS 279.74 TaxID=1314801 RepID=A0A6G1JX70_9PLEO|nr:hypothetical protein K504DRAFT_472098 [Pleomassaria siparia CBS 279.74]